ncbi:MAG: hypothetical protein HUU49_02930 [Candidatus Buchananbacteria bacterium]|nr:hypothetical protein [Candidatus Buchananbacteria bacterium]
MAFREKKAENNNILEEIYHNDPQGLQQKKPIKQKIVNFFHDKKKVDHLLSATILVLGLAAVVLGFFQFKWNINSYFVVKPTDPLTLNANINTEQDLLGLRQKDTDLDGLSDYDELKIYATSPYLPDTDSDGIDDKTEIAKKTNPTCPEGKDCFVEWSVLDPQSGSLVGIDLQATDEERAAQLRRALVQEGLDPQELAQLSDQEILALYQELLNQIKQEQPSPTVSTGLAGQDINNLTPAQVRELLKSAGVSQEILNELDDQELMQLVSETVTNANKTNGQTSQ